MRGDKKNKKKWTRTLASFTVLKFPLVNKHVPDPRQAAPWWPTLGPPLLVSTHCIRTTAQEAAAVITLTFQSRKQRLGALQ